jgi:hypothetical protein
MRPSPIALILNSEVRDTSVSSAEEGPASAFPGGRDHQTAAAADSGPEPTSAGTSKAELEHLAAHHGMAIWVDLRGVDPAAAHELADAMRRLAEQDPARFRGLAFLKSHTFTGDEAN